MDNNASTSCPTFPERAGMSSWQSLLTNARSGGGMPLGSPEQMASFEAYAMRVAEHEGWADENTLDLGGIQRGL
jgi:hypothetical protein